MNNVHTFFFRVLKRKILEHLNIEKIEIKVSREVTSYNVNVFIDNFIIILKFGNKPEIELFNEYLTTKPTRSGENFSKIGK